MNRYRLTVQNRNTQGEYSIKQTSALIAVCLPVQVGEAQQEAVLHCVEDAALVAHVAEGQLLPRIFEH